MIVGDRVRENYVRSNHVAVRYGTIVSIDEHDPGHFEVLTDSGLLEYWSVWGTEPVDEESKSVDMVNEPPHYKQGGLEAIDVLTAFFPKNPLLWQVGKYILRAEHKGNTVEDLKKAEFYLKREITRLENL